MILSLVVITWLFAGTILVPDSYSQIDSIKLTATTTTHNSSISSPCNCVVFRMDDVQDNFVDTAQLAAMNLFLSKNQSLTVGLIMNSIGNDSKIMGQVAEGYHKGLFELALHGWDHVDYTQLNEQQQQYSLKEANEKMQKLFGNTSDIFITPYGTFDKNTLKAMGQLGIKILSAATYSDKNSSIFNANANNNSKSNQSSEQSVVYHMPGMSLFKDDEHNKAPVKTPIGQILSDVDSNIKKYGYSIIIFHPQDFVKTDQHGNVISKALVMSQMNDLSRLVDSVLSKHIQITSFSKILRGATMTHRMPSSTQTIASFDKSEPQQWVDNETKTKIEFVYSPAVPMVGKFTDLNFSVQDPRTGVPLKDVTARVTVLPESNNDNNTSSSFDSSYMPYTNSSITNVSSSNGDISVMHKFLSGGMFQVILRVNSGSYGIALASFNVYVI